MMKNCLFMMGLSHFSKVAETPWLPMLLEPGTSEVTLSYLTYMYLT